MKFREYAGLKPMTVSASSCEGLDAELEALAEEYDFIDLQFAMTDNKYSALALLKKKEL